MTCKFMKRSEFLVVLARIFVVFYCLGQYFFASINSASYLCFSLPATFTYYRITSTSSAAWWYAWQCSTECARSADERLELWSEFTHKTGSRRGHQASIRTAVPTYNLLHKLGGKGAVDNYSAKSLCWCGFGSNSAFWRKYRTSW